MVTTESQLETNSAKTAAELSKIRATRVSTLTKTPEISTVTKQFFMRLGIQETVDCFKQTEIAEHGLPKFISKFSKLSLNATRIYKEVSSEEGSITGELSTDLFHIRNLTQGFNDSSGCKMLNKNPRFDVHCCAVRIKVPKTFFVVVEIKWKHVTTIVMYDEKWTKRAKYEKNVFIGSSNVVNIVQYVLVDKDEDKVDGRFQLRFQAVDHPGLTVKLTSLNRGFVQTYFYGLGSYMVTPLVDPWARVNVPAGHLIMVSMPAVQAIATASKHVTLFAEDRDNTTLLKNYLKIPSASIHNTSLLLIRFDTRGNDDSFHMDFSFHNESTLPVKLADNTWNCSVSYKSDFLHHMFCDTVSTCHDIADCLNATDLCGPGVMKLGGACFFFVRFQPLNNWTANKLISWNTAYDMCSLHDGRLPTIRIADTWKDVVRVLSSEFVFVGMIFSESNIPFWYKHIPQWIDGTMAYYVPTDMVLTYTDCKLRHRKKCVQIITRERTRSSFRLNIIKCTQEDRADLLCETSSPQDASFISINGTDRFPPDAPYVICPRGYYTHQFNVCDVKASCWSRDYSSRCASPLTLIAPSFACTNEMGRVPYTLVCDHRVDCFDGSDEDFCRIPPCGKNQFSCNNKQCIESSKICDGWRDCYLGEDEDLCPVRMVIRVVATRPPPALVSLSDNGRLVVRGLNSTVSREHGPCPPTHFQCSHNGYCLPVFLRCNAVFDCPGKEDEDGPGCDTCPGFYRCRASQICVHYSDLCDGHAHCPQNDDELLCDSICPSFCVCRGLEFLCRRRFTATAYPLLRFLDASGTAMTPADLTANSLLIHLILASCGLAHLEELLFFPNLLTLDVRDNTLKSISRVNLKDIPQLRELSLAGNPLVLDFQRVQDFPTLYHLQKLDLSRVLLFVLNIADFSAFPNLRILNLSHSGVQTVQGELFHNVHLRVIDLRGCPMTWFPRGMFQVLEDLRAVYTHTFKVCCPAVLPIKFNLHNCFAPEDEISSCDNLLRSNGYSVSVFVLALLSVAGNAVSFIFRTYISKHETKRGYGNFVTHLSVSDFLMGVYLAIIGVADQVYSGSYLWNEVVWKHSLACRLAGFLSLLSSEVSALIMCLITVDRFLVLRFPFSRLHFSPKSAHMASIAVWIGGGLLASVPLLPVTSHWEFYSQTSICIPLPVTRPDFAGYKYSFGIVIVFNFVVFVVISMGQLNIYWSVIANSMAVSNTTKKTKDLTIARRLITVAMTDFLCWFPIGVLGLMASNGVPIPGEVNVVVAIFVLPLNSAVNPCLYTLNVVLERRRRSREEKIRASLLALLKSGN